MSEKWLYQSDLCLIYPSIFSAEIIPEIIIVRENYIPIFCGLNQYSPQHIPILYFLVEKVKLHPKNTQNFLGQIG